MRSTLRYVLTFTATLFFGLLIFTAETVVDEVGYTATVRRIVREGWAISMEAGYSDWLFAAALLFSGAAAALWLDYLLRPANPFKEVKKKIEKRVAGKSFINEKVYADGVHFDNCEFRNVTVIYNGGASSLTNNKFTGGIGMGTEIPEILNYLTLLAEFKLISVPAIGPEGTMNFDGVQWTDGVGTRT